MEFGIGVQRDPINTANHGTDRRVRMKVLQERVEAMKAIWIPNFGPPDLLERVAALRSRADREIPVMAMGVPADPAVLETLQEAGFARVAHWIPSASHSVVEAALERWEAAIAQRNGEA